MPRNKNLDFPIFTIYGDKQLDKDAEIAINIKSLILDLTESLTELSNQLCSIGKRLNLYINNIITLKKPFDYKQHLLIFNCNEELCIYTHKEIDKYMDKFEKEFDIDNEEEFVKNLPNTKNKYELKESQKRKTVELIEEYNDVYSEYEYELFEFDEYNSNYDSIIQDVKEKLVDIKLLEIDRDSVTDVNAFEPFSEEKHELIIVKDSETSKWKFIYVRKEDKDKLLNS